MKKYNNKIFSSKKIEFEYDYKKSFEAFVSSTNQKRQTAPIIQSIINKAVDSFGFIEKNTPLKIADIGCADGKTCGLCLSEVNYSPGFNYVGVDIIDEYLLDASNLLSKQPNFKKITMIRGDIFYDNETQEKIAQEGPFDIIFISHMLYYMEPEKYADFMKNITSYLTLTGFVILVHQKITPDGMPYFREKYSLSHTKDVPLLLSNVILEKENEFSFFSSVSFVSQFGFGKIPLDHWRKLRSPSLYIGCLQEISFDELLNKLNFILQHSLVDLYNKDPNKLIDYLEEIQALLRKNNNCINITSHMQFIASPSFLCGEALEKILHQVQNQVIDQQNDDVSRNQSSFCGLNSIFDLASEDKIGIRQQHEDIFKTQSAPIPMGDLWYSFLKDLKFMNNKTSEFEESFKCAKRISPHLKEEEEKPELKCLYPSFPYRSNT